MTDRVLSEDGVCDIEGFLAKRFEWTPEEWTEIAALTTSHRLLQQQVTELEEKLRQTYQGNNRR